MALRAKQGFLSVQDVSNDGTPVPFLLNVRQDDIIPPEALSFTDIPFTLQKYIKGHKLYTDGSVIHYKRYLHKPEETTAIMEITLKVPINLGSNFFRVPSDQATTGYTQYFTPTTYGNRYKSGGFYFGHSDAHTRTNAMYTDPNCTITESTNIPRANVYAWRPYIPDFYWNGIDVENNSRSYGNSNNADEVGWWSQSGSNFYLSTKKSALVCVYEFDTTLMNIKELYNKSFEIKSKGPLAQALSTAYVDCNFIATGSYYNKILIKINNNSNTHYATYGMTYFEPDNAIDDSSGYNKPYVETAGYYPNNDIPGCSNNSAYVEINLEVGVAVDESI